MTTYRDGIRELVLAAREGDQGAWRGLVERFAPLVWAVIRQHGLERADAKDANQLTWVALAEHIHRLRDPDRLPGWLATTARRECLRLHALRRRELRCDPMSWLDLSAQERGPELLAVCADRDRLLWRAFGTLPARCQRLLRLLAHAPELSYARLAYLLGIRPGSLGPTRARCLTLLRRRLAALDVGVDAAG